MLEKLTELPGFAKRISQFLLKLIGNQQVASDDFRVMKLLINVGAIEGLQFYVDWVKTNHRLPRTYDRLLNIRRLPTTEATLLFAELIHFAFQETIETDRFDEPIDIFVHCLKELTITKEGLYQAVHADLDTLLQTYPTHPDQAKLRRNLALFEQEYYLQKVDCATLPEALVGLETWIP
ncbi:hypothetical protein J2I47_07570 [Fibrella sp. HMF5335]|uniref:Uncharacterized protein n=1 Tax=Fibrella rubiginis TaxID=2817060 RepID=A0A939GFQ5_9BACT|nr:hypothetical protein [Fibrella rubiginis]MBO0936404.1 hypothetical protein [Fibrella rubiginis]